MLLPLMQVPAVAPVPEAFATDLGAPQERSCRGLDGRCWWADGPGHHSSSLLQLPGHEPKTSHPLLTHVTSASRPVHWAGLVRMGTGSDACLGWYNREQSCENESLCLEMASLGLQVRTGLASLASRRWAPPCAPGSASPASL